MMNAAGGSKRFIAPDGTVGRPRVRDDRRLRRVALASAIRLALYALALALTDAAGTSGRLINDGAYLIPVAPAAVSSLVAARRSIAVLAGESKH